MTEELKLRLFGSPAVTLNQALVSSFVSAKTEALLYYLAVTGQPHGRQALAALFWGDFPDTNALKNLRDALSNLRRLVPDHLIIDRQTVAFRREAPYWLDTEQFLARTERLHSKSPIAGPADVQLLQEAAGLYTAPFLQDFQVDEEAFADWQEQQRERFAQLALRCLYTLATFYTEEGEYDTAFAYCERLLALAPWHEEAHCQLMLLYALTQQRSVALSQYHRCRQLLADELGVEPAAQTTRLYEQIIDNQVVKPTASPTSPGRKYRPSPPVAHNLPNQLTTFIGRETELAQVVNCLQNPDCRLLTLVGVGGVGKTRLALQAGHRLLAAARQGQWASQGIYFIPLAGVESAALLPATIATTLAVSLFGLEEPAVQLTNFLRDKELLLILDNAEHLLAGASLIAAILQSGAKVKILATSRERLNIYGERVVELKGLPVPDEANGAAVGPAENSTAAHLFEHYAQSFRANFHLHSAADRQAIRQICHLLDGLPLGIELAASWTRLLPVADIASEIESNLDFLASPARDAPIRHHSLRAVFDYSWNLLTPAEQQILSRLSVFRSRFSREAAAAVAQAPLVLLASLVDKSLLDCTIHDEPGRAGVRYEMLEVIRQYAAERLAAKPVEQQEVLWRHCAYYATFLGRLKNDLEAGAQPEALGKIHSEIENIRSGWRWGVENRDWLALNQTMDSLFHFYDMSSWFQEGRDAFAQAALVLQAEPAHAHILARLLARQGWFTFHLGRQHEAQALLEQSLLLLRELDARPDIVFSLNYLGAVTYYLGMYSAALAICHEALTISQSLNDRRGMTIAYNILFQIELLLGDYDSAEERGRQVIALAQPVKNLWSTSFALVNLGDVALFRGQYAKARDYFLESKALREQLSDQRGLAICLNRLGDVSKATGQLKEAREHYRQSLRIYQDISNQWGLAYTFGRLAWTMLELQENEAAAAYFSQSLPLALRIGAEAVVLDALAGVAALLLQRPEGRSGVSLLLVQELLQLVDSHPGSTRATRDQAARLVSTIQTLPARPGFSPDMALLVEQALQALGPL